MTLPNIYIPSKGRHNKCLTADILKEEGIPFKLVIEQQDADAYAKIYGKKNCLVMIDNNQGIAHARNYIKSYSICNGQDYHWQIDDNIRNFLVRVGDKNVKSTALHSLSYIEEWVRLYSNIGIASPIHKCFAFFREGEVGLNKQVYSCVFVNNATPVWWRPDTIDDMDYSLQVLTVDDNKWCTLLFHKIIIEKVKSMKMSGGNTEIEYLNGGRERRAKGLIAQWPEFKGEYKYGKFRIRPSRIWKRFKQQPILLEDKNENT